MDQAVGLMARLAAVERRGAYSFLGFALAILFGAIMLWDMFVRDTHARVSVELLSDASVLDVQERLPGLSILLSGIDIAQTKQTLRVLVFRLRNTGSESVLKSHFDERDPLGIQLGGARVLSCELVAAKTEYLQHAVTFDQSRDGIVAVQPFILDPGDWMTFKIIALYPTPSRVGSRVVGKIAGVGSIELADVSRGSGQPAFLVRTFAGGLAVQTLRLLAYTIVGLILLVAVAIAVTGASERLERRTRRRRVARFRATVSLHSAALLELAFAKYVQSGRMPLRALFIANERGSLSAAIESYESRYDASSPEVWIHLPLFAHWAKELTSAEYIEKTDNMWKLTTGICQPLEEFLRFLAHEEHSRNIGNDHLTTEAIIGSGSKSVEEPPGRTSDGE